MTFDKGELRLTLDKVETYLGYLKGNELAYDYLDRVNFENAQYDTRPAGSKNYQTQLDADYEFPCPDAFYRVRPDSRVSHFSLWIYYDADHPPKHLYDDFMKQVQQQADVAYRGGADWASGLGGYLFELCARFAEPDTSDLVAKIQDLCTRVVDPLKGGARDDWANIGAYLTEWHGEGHDAFDRFYENYNDALAQFSLFSSYIAAGFAAATKLIDGTQVGAQKFATSMVTILEDALDSWVIYGGPPQEPPKEPAWIADIPKLYQDAGAILDLVPVVSEVKKGVDTVTGVVDSVNKLAVDLGADPPKKSTTRIETRTADELYSLVTDTLYQDYYGEYEKALGRLESGDGPIDVDNADKVPFSGQNVMGLVQSLKTRKDWQLQKVTSDGSLYSGGDGTYPPDRYG